VLRRIFGPKWNEVTGGWRKLHNEELHGMAGTSRTNGERRNAYRLLVRKPQEKRPLGRPKRR
jgi:hypothetical protein